MEMVEKLVAALFSVPGLSIVVTAVIGGQLRAEQLWSASGRNPLALSFARIAASILSVFTFAQAIARTRIGLETTTLPTKGDSSRTMALVLPVASMTIPSLDLSFVANCNKRLRARSIIPASRSLPFSRMAT